MSNLIVIIILSVILVLTFFVITLLLFLFQKHRKLVLNNFTQDLNKNYQSVQIKKIANKDLLKSFNELKEDIYFFNRAIFGKYEKPQKIINEKNWLINEGLKHSKIKIFYHYKLINLSPSKFVPLNKIDLILTRNKFYLYDPLEPKVIMITKIKDITIFWEKNRLMQQKEFFPGVGFKYQNQNYFLLFQSYNDVIKFLSYLNFLS